jgi:hypothetical protein
LGWGSGLVVVVGRSPGVYLFFDPQGIPHDGGMSE